MNLIFNLAIMSLAINQQEVFTRSEMDLLQVFIKTKNNEKPIQEGVFIKTEMELFQTFSETNNKPIKKDFFAKTEMEDPMASFLEMIDLLKTDTNTSELYSNLISIYNIYGVNKAEKHLEEFLEYSNLDYLDLIA